MPDVKVEGNGVQNRIGDKVPARKETAKLTKLRQSLRDDGTKPNQPGFIIVDGLEVTIALKATSVDLTDTEYRILARNGGLAVDIPVMATICGVNVENQTAKVIGDKADAFLNDVQDIVKQ